MKRLDESEEVRRESSTPVQSRVDIRSLAELGAYFEDVGMEIRSASQLMSWGVEMLVETLRKNEKIEGIRPEIDASYTFLESRGLMQRGMKKKKLDMARAFEQLRLEGESPEVVAPAVYKQIHNNKKWTGGELPSLVKNAGGDGSRWDEDFRKAREYERKQEMEEVERQRKSLLEGSTVVGEINGEKILEPADWNVTPHSVVTQKDMDEFKHREEKREEIEEVGKVRSRKKGELNKLEKEIEDDFGQTESCQ